MTQTHPNAHPAISLRFRCQKRPAISAMGPFLSILVSLWWLAARGVLVCLARANSTSASLFSFKTVLLLQDRLDLRDLVERKWALGTVLCTKGPVSLLLVSEDDDNNFPAYSPSRLPFRLLLLRLRLPNQSELKRCQIVAPPPFSSPPLLGRLGHGSALLPQVQFLYLHAASSASASRRTSTQTCDSRRATLKILRLPCNQAG